MSKENVDDLFKELDDAVEDDASKLDIEISESAKVPQQDTQELMDRIKEAEDRALRAQAELENFRARTRREMDDQLKFANQSLLSDMLPVIDNIGRALSAASQDETSGGLSEGVLMVAQQMIDTLERHHCKRIEAVGTEFDPHLHEAVSQIPSDEYPAGQVAQVVQEGYLLHDRVIRPAHVIISSGPAESAE